MMRVADYPLLERVLHKLSNDDPDRIALQELLTRQQGIRSKCSAGSVIDRKLRQKSVLVGLLDKYNRGEMKL